MVPRVFSRSGPDFNQVNFVDETFPHIEPAIPPCLPPPILNPPCNEYTLIHVAYLNGGRDTEARGGVCVMKDCTGVENFVFAREGNFNFVSAWRQISIQERRRETPIAMLGTREMALLLIKNTKERRPMFKMREQRKYIRYIWDKGAGLLQDGIELENGGLYTRRQNLHVINVYREKSGEREKAGSWWVGGRGNNAHRPGWVILLIWSSAVLANPFFWVNIRDSRDGS